MNNCKRITSPMKEQNDTPTKKFKTNNNEAKLFIGTEISSESFDNFFDDDDFSANCDLDSIVLESDAVPAKPLIDLSKWQRCIVAEVERDKKTFALILHLRLMTEESVEEHDKENNVGLTKCQLQKQWSQIEVKAGDIVSIQAIYDETLKCYKVDNEYGFCVTNPDTLISSTSVVGSLFCRRKAVLQDRFKGIAANSKIMVVGSMVHELLQLVLQKGLRNSQEIESAAQELLNSTETSYELYGNLMTRDELSVELEKFIPNVVNFVEQYLIGNAPAEQLKESFSGTITDIQDIEENIWTPQLGLKGKIDVSVRIRRRPYEKSSNAIPLELKTGRATFSMEHRGQVILYQMMLSAIGRETNSSLLLYLREGLMRELRGTRNEQRDLIILRNDLAHYISYKNDIPSVTIGLDDKYVQPIKLPNPISHHSACGNCEYATICCTFAKTDPGLQLRSGHPLHAVIQTVTEHLQAEDYRYFMHWCGLLLLEEQDMRKSNNMRALWTNTPEQRKHKGLALIDMQLKDVSADGMRYIHNFLVKVSKDNENNDLLLSGFSMGEYVIVSTHKRLAIAAGCIADITSDHISISLERDLRKNYTMDTFIIDKHESQSGNTFNFTNISLLLDANERAKRLREIVVQRTQPTYGKVLPKIIATQGAAILKQLNAVQRAAVLKALTTESYMLIKGLPGTGKTQTLVAIVRLLYLMGKTILITSHTHSAVDNLLVRLKIHKLPILRLGSGARIKTELQEFGESMALKGCNTVEDITVKYNSFNIVGVTCLGSSHPLFLHRRFDYCIVDEATQVMQPTTLRPLFFCDKFILVGDPDQLPPLIRSREARQLGADESLFERLDTQVATSVLTLQYRMNKSITSLANELTYKGALQCASKEVELDTLQLELHPHVDKVEKWLQRALQTHINQAVFLLDTKDCSERLSALAKKNSLDAPEIDKNCLPEHESSTDCTKPTFGAIKRISKYTNLCEAAIIICILEQLLKAGYAAERIGVIAPYRAQVELLRKLMTQFEMRNKIEVSNSELSTVEINTVDQYQGRDKDIILFSGTKTGTVDLNEIGRDAEILEDKRRLTVAITRAKRKLILISDAACLQRYTPFQVLLGHIPSYCKLQLEDGKLGFEWQKLYEKLNNIATT